MYQTNPTETFRERQLALLEETDNRRLARQVRLAARRTPKEGPIMRRTQKQLTQSNERRLAGDRKKVLCEMGRQAIFILAAMIALSVLATGPAAALSGDTLAWGENDSGMLGNGTYDSSTTPVEVSNLGSVKMVRGGCDHSLALKEDGTVWAWGHNGNGQLGNGTTGGGSPMPVQVSNLGGVKAIATGCDHNLALKEDGTVWAWGANYSGALGNDTVGASSNVPVQVSNLSGVKAMAAGYTHNLALKGDGTVWAWGNNYVGQLGNETISSYSTTPVEVKTATGATLGGVKAIAAGDEYSLALMKDGTLHAWGCNGSGQLGNGSYDNSIRPVQVKTAGGATFGDVKAISTVGIADHALALKSNGTVWAWGYNGYGQLGDGTYDSSNTPIKVKTASGATLGGVKAIATGYYHSLALKKDGTVRAWGDNDYGVLGDGTNEDASSPVKVKTASGATLGGIKAIAAGNFHSLAVKQ